MLNILVTGGAGFIGSTFVRMLLNGSLSESKDLNITVLDSLDYAGDLANLGSSIDDPRLDVVIGEIQDAKLTAKILKGTDVVFNFAAKSHVDRSIKDPAPFFITNVIGTQTILQASLENSVKTFVHISTDEVYGSIQSGSFSESSPLKPNSPYSASKASSDLIIRSYFKTYGIDARVTRCTNNYGPYQFPEKFIPLAITNVLTGKPIPIYGSGAQVRDWIHVEDHCRGIWKVYESGHPGMVVNIGGGEEITNIQLARKILLLMNCPLDSITTIVDRPGHDFRYSLNVDYLQSFTDYMPLNNLEEGLKNTINWYKENENWWRKSV
jgi:dTDP-glucose 4,6-dehydratase